MTYAQYFKEIKRGDDLVMIPTDDCPEKLRDLIREIHFDYFGGCLPNDWIYSTIAQAFDDLETDDIENCCIEADIWAKDLCQWFGRNPAYSIDYCAEYVEEFGVTGKDLGEQISNGQWLAKNRIYQAVDDWIKKQPEIE